MRNIRLILLLYILITTIFVTEAEGQSEHSTFKHLLGQSDVIIQGKVDQKDCIIEELGVQSCIYRLQVDSIFKGRISAEEYLNIVQPLYNQPVKSSNAIIFHNACFGYLYSPSRDQPPAYFEDNCIKSGQHYILFLKRKSRPANIEGSRVSYYFILADQWFGFQPANSYMASYLRSFCK